MVNKGVLLFCFLCLSGAVTATSALSRQTPAPKETKPLFRAGAIRYQVTDVDRSVAFYTGKLGFTTKGPHGPAFAGVTHGTLTLWLSGPGSSGSRPLQDGRAQKPGGWNRLVLEVADLPAVMTKLKKDGVRFRNALESGPGGRQVQIEDPDGNPIELFEAAS